MQAIIEHKCTDLCKLKIEKLYPGAIIKMTVCQFEHAKHNPYNPFGRY